MNGDSQNPAVIVANGQQIIGPMPKLFFTVASEDPSLTTARILEANCFGFIPLMSVVVRSAHAWPITLHLFGHN
jgi:hypothetical protein